jgi:hypothetical protein
MQMNSTIGIRISKFMENSLGKGHEDGPVEATDTGRAGSVAAARLQPIRRCAYP